MPSLSRDLEATLRFAIKLANDRRYEYATLEHLLAGLLQDRDAGPAINALARDSAALYEAVHRYLNEDLVTLVQDAGYDEEAKPTTGFQRVVQRAVLYAANSKIEEVNGIDMLIALFTERESHAVYFLGEAGINRLAVVDYRQRLSAATKPQAGVNRAKILQEAIEKSAEQAPHFRVSRGRIRFAQAAADGRLKEYKAAARERSKELQQKCALRGNEQPQLKSIVDRYVLALERLRKDSGAYQLLLVGEELRSILHVKQSAPADTERNLPIDADLEFAARSLLTAHAGLMTLFPDAMATSAEIDRFQEQAGSVAALMEKAIDPVLRKLEGAEGVFDEETKEISSEMAAVRGLAVGEAIPSRTVAAAKIGWVRGALASMSHYVVRKFDGTDKAVRDAIIKEGVSAVARNRDTLFAAVYKFLVAARDDLLSLAHSASTSFRWLESLLKWLGLL